MESQNLRPGIFALQHNLQDIAATNNIEFIQTANRSSPQVSPKLPSAMAPIHLQVRTRHEPARIADQKHRAPSIILRHAQLPQHVLLRPLDPPLGKPLEQLLDHRRHNVPRRNRVDPDAKLAPLRRQVARELDDARFGSIIRRTNQTLHSTHTQVSSAQLLENTPR